ncbi:MAG: hypothetical protein IJI57_04385 [Flexilinea sp.]|nr:hypothetical protein [Flexilinea sp.]
MGGSASYRLARRIANARDRGAPQSEIDELERRRQDALTAERQKRQAAKQPPEKSFLDKLNSAKDEEELRKVMLEKYKPGFIHKEFLNKDLGMLKRALKTIDELETRFPEMKGKVHEFNAKYEIGTYGSMSLTGQLSITQSWDNFDDPDLYGDKNGWFHKNRTPEAVIAHEFAHAITARILEKKYPELFDDGDIRPSKIYANYEDYLQVKKEWSNGAFLKPLRKEALKALGLKVKDENLATRQISRYAELNIHEAFAEAFADVFANGDNASEASKAYTNALINALRS